MDSVKPNFSRLFLILITLLFWLPIPAYAIPPEKPIYFYRDHEVCHKYYGQETSLNNCGLYPAYLNSTDCPNAALHIGCTEYIDTLTPTLRWHIADHDSSQIHYELQITKSWWFDGEPHFLKVIDYTSDKFSPGDCSFTVGQTLGTYNNGYNISTLGTWGIEETYYWRIRGCDENDCGPWLFSGGNETIDEEPAFKTPADFIGIGDDVTVLYTPTSSSIEIAVNTPFNLESFSIEYGTNENYGFETAIQSNVTGVVKTKITGLQEDTLYFYRPRWHKDNNSYLGKQATFRTARGEGKSFKFAILSDLHISDSSDYSNLLSQIPIILASEPDFIVDLGDYVNADAGNAFFQDIMNAVFLRGFELSTKLYNSVPVMHAVGNHEAINQFYGKSGCENYFNSFLCKSFLNDPNSLAAASWQKYYSTFQNGNIEGTYYSWEWGDAKFIVLDPFLYTTEWPADCQDSQPYTLGEEQKQWLLNELSNSEKTWAIIFIHHLLSGSEPDGFDNYCYARASGALVNTMQGTTWEEILTPLRNYQKVIVFMGHEHIYSIEKPFGYPIVYCPTNTRHEKLARGTWDWYYHNHTNPLLETVNCDSTIDASGDVDVIRDVVTIKEEFYNLLTDGDRVRFTGSAELLPRGQTGDQDVEILNGFYYVKKVGKRENENCGEIKIYATQDFLNGEPINITNTGIGMHTLCVYYALQGHMVVEVHQDHIQYHLIDNDGKIITPDSDRDGIPDYEDNCPHIPNPLQQDTFPMYGNGIGDACDCEGNFDCDADCDGRDAKAFKVDFGRSVFDNPCESGDPCNGDFDCDSDSDGTDAATFKADFGRSTFSNPCPICIQGEEGCVY